MLTKETGVLYLLCKRLHRNKVSDYRPLFDIVAGTSIGTLKAAILESVVNRKKTWEEDPKELNFWKTSQTIMDFKKRVKRNLI